MQCSGNRCTRRAGTTRAVAFGSQSTVASHIERTCDGDSRLEGRLLFAYRFGGLAHDVAITTYGSPLPLTWYSYPQHHFISDDDDDGSQKVVVAVALHAIPILSDA